MSRSFTEKSLRFDFDDGWKTCGQWDGTIESRYKSTSTTSGGSVRGS